jgi:hypothetical protein
MERGIAAAGARSRAAGSTGNHNHSCGFRTDRRAGAGGVSEYRALFGEYRGLFSARGPTGVVAWRRVLD